MEIHTIKDLYGHLFIELQKRVHESSTIDETNVFQEANPEIREILKGFLKENLLPGAKLEGTQHIKDFMNQVHNGKRGLVLMEHYSNMDLPVFCYLLDRDGGEEGKELSDKMVAIAGMKLNEESPVVKAFAEGFTRVVIYPSRSLNAITDPEEKEKEEAKSRKINMASMRAMDKCKRAGRPILVFPAGTRYRPGNPETMKGVREIDSYLRLFDVMLFISTNGNILRINPESPNDMVSDLVHPDTILMAASPVMECKKFRNDVLATLEDYEGDKKVIVVDKIMEELKKYHGMYKQQYLDTYKKATGEEADIDQD